MTTRNIMAGIALMICGGLLYAQTEPTDTDKNNETDAAYMGRYELLQLSESAQSRYVIDNLSGRLWHLLQGDGGPALVPIPYRTLGLTFDRDLIGFRLAAPGESHERDAYAALLELKRRGALSESQLSDLAKVEQLVARMSEALNTTH